MSSRPLPFPIRYAVAIRLLVTFPEAAGERPAETNASPIRQVPAVCARTVVLAARAAYLGTRAARAAHLAKGTWPISHKAPGPDSPDSYTAFGSTAVLQVRRGTRPSSGERGSVYGAGVAQTLRLDGWRPVITGPA